MFRPMGSIFLSVATISDVCTEYRSPRRFFLVRSWSEPPDCGDTVGLSASLSLSLAPAPAPTSYHCPHSSPRLNTRQPRPIPVSTPDLANLSLQTPSPDPRPSQIQASIPNSNFYPKSFQISLHSRLSQLLAVFSQNPPRTFSRTPLLPLHNTYNPPFRAQDRVSKSEMKM